MCPAAGPHARLRLLNRHLSPPLATGSPSTRPRSPAWPAAALEPARGEVVPGTSFVPARTSDPAEALALLRRDGGVVFRAVPEGVTLSERAQREVAADIPRRIFGEGLAQIRPGPSRGGSAQ